MAFQKTHSPKPGISGAYWKIIGISIDYRSETTNAVLALYPNSATNGVDPLDLREYQWQGTAAFPMRPANLDPAGVNPQAMAYGKIKNEDAFFADASDV